MKETLMNFKKMVRIFIIIFVGLLVIAIIFLIIVLKTPASIEFNNVTITARDYKSIQEKFNDQQMVRVCNLENKQCILLYKIGGEE